MRKIVIAWLTALCFLLLGNVHAWEVPNYIRMTSGARMWFTVLDGDLIQDDRTKIDLIDNAGIERNKLSWEFLTSVRAYNIHVWRFRAEPLSGYESKNDSYLRVRNYRTGYDLDFYMSPQALFGANIDINITNLETRIQDVIVGGNTYTYQDSKTRTTPLLGLHGSFYPILDDISLRPNVSARVNWWNYENLETWDWEISGAVDIPINRLWTWTVNGGYRFWHTKFKRERDTIDINRMGFFLESSLLF